MNAHLAAERAGESGARRRQGDGGAAQVQYAATRLVAGGNLPVDGRAFGHRRQVQVGGNAQLNGPQQRAFQAQLARHLAVPWQPLGAVQGHHATDLEIRNLAGDGVAIQIANQHLAAEAAAQRVDNHAVEFQIAAA